MTIAEFINHLQHIRPTEAEVAAALEDSDRDHVISLIDMNDYQVNDTFFEYNSVLLNCIYNTTVYEKGLAEFYFVSALDKSFAYTDDDHNFFLEGSNVYLEYEGEYKLIGTSEADFLYGMICCFKANIDFAYRRSISTLNDTLQTLADKVPGTNADYFIERLKFAYSDW